MESSSLVATWPLLQADTVGMTDQADKDKTRRPATAADLSLAQQIISGDRDSLQVAYDRYSDLVFRTAYWLTKTTAEAEDAMQEVFLGLPGTLGSFDGRGSLAAWLRRVTVRTVLMERRSRRRRFDILNRRPDRLPSRSEAPDVIMQITLEEGIRSLPDNQRLVFVLKDVYGFSHAEIGELLGISIKASRLRLFRARDNLRKHLSAT